MEDWYRISPSDVHSNNGWGLVNMYSDLREAVMDTFHDHPWEPWRFRNVNYYWVVQSNRALFFKYPPIIFCIFLHDTFFMTDSSYLFKKLGYTTMDDWYKVKGNDFEEAGVQVGNSGEFVSFTRSLMRTFPEHDWQEWRFRKFSFFSASHDQVKSYVSSLGSFLGVKRMEEWYTVTYDQIKQHGMCDNISIII